MRKKIFVLLSLVLSCSLPCLGAELVVNTLLDVVDPNDGFLSLREAVANANDHDQISFSINLLDREIVVNSPVPIYKTIEINGSISDDRQKRIIISGNGTSGIFDISADRDYGKVIFSQLVLKNGKRIGTTGDYNNSNGGSSLGGAVCVYTAAVVRWEDVTFLNNAVRGGNSDTFRGNGGNGLGGAIFIAANIRAEVYDCAFFHNQAYQGLVAQRFFNPGGADGTGLGGAIYAEDGVTLLLENTVFSKNYAQTAPNAVGASHSQIDDLVNTQDFRGKFESYKSFISSIEWETPPASMTDQGSFLVTFSEPVTGVDAGDFKVVNLGGRIADSSILAVETVKKFQYRIVVDIQEGIPFSHRLVTGDSVSIEGTINTFAANNKILPNFYYGRLESIHLNDPNPLMIQFPSFLFTFNHPVMNFSEEDLRLDTTGISEERFVACSKMNDKQFWVTADVGKGGPGTLAVSFLDDYSIRVEQHAVPQIDFLSYDPNKQELLSEAYKFAYTHGSITVNSNQDGQTANFEDSQITLREAILASNGGVFVGNCHAGFVRNDIRFDASVSTIALTNDLPGIARDLRIMGNGKSSMVLDGQGEYRGLVINGNHLYVENMAFNNLHGKGYPGGNGGQGGGGSAGVGGALLVHKGRAICTDILFSNNRVTGGNGGNSNGTLTGTGGGGGGFGGPGGNGSTSPVGVAGTSGSGGVLGAEAAGGSAAYGQNPHGGWYAGGAGQGNGGFGGGAGGCISTAYSGTTPGSFGGNGGAYYNYNGSGGGGGAGLGGAIFARSDSEVWLQNCDLVNNTAAGGNGGDGASGGQGKGGAIFAMENAIVKVNNLTFSQNQAANSDSEGFVYYYPTDTHDVYGVLMELTEDVNSAFPPITAVSDFRVYE